MEAIKLDNITVARGVILESQVKEVAQKIFRELKGFYLHYGCREFQFNADNGIRIDVEARYNDEDGGSIELETISVVDNLLFELEDDAEKIGDEIDTLLEEYNYSQRFNYDASYMSKKELFAEYNV